MLGQPQDLGLTAKHSQIKVRFSMKSGALTPQITTQTPQENFISSSLQGPFQRGDRHADYLPLPPRSAEHLSIDAIPENRLTVTLTKTHVHFQKTA